MYFRQGGKLEAISVKESVKGGDERFQKQKTFLMQVTVKKIAQLLSVKVRSGKKHGQSCWSVAGWGGKKGKG